MELNNNFIGIQGILIEGKEQIGDFRKINYIGGNEDNIRYITAQLATFLINENLLEEAGVPPSRIKDLNELIFFLALNTEFKKELPISDEFTHLTNITPQLSKCVFVNICFSLNLCEQFAYVIQTLPLEATDELLDQAIACLRKEKLQDHLHNAFVMVKSVINKLSLVELSHKTDDTVDDITRVTSIILQNLTGVATDQIHSTKALKIYQHLGFTLLKLFELLLYLDGSKKSLMKLTESLISTTCNIIKCVTLDVFCSWSEVNYEDQPLQAAIANKAFLVIEKFQQNKLAVELVSLLSSITRKPKSIAERILEADLSTTIKMVDKADEHQKLWFSALFNRIVYLEPRILECLDRWWQLCDEGAVERLINLSVPKDPQETQLILKCASNLNLGALTGILTRYFYRQNFKWTSNISNQQVLIFNQINGAISEEESKQILLLLLQNGEAFFLHFYATAFKRSAELTQIFELVQDISRVDNLGLQTLMKVLAENVPAAQNVSNYVQLFSTMLSCQYYTWDFMVSHVVLPLISQYRNSEANLEEFKCCFQILKHFKNVNCELQTEIQLYKYILTSAAESRCKSFLEFDSLRNEITGLCVDFLLSKCQTLKIIIGKKESFPDVGTNIDDPWSNYYKDQFFSNKECCFTDWILPNFNLLNYKEGEVEENFTSLLKILPRCAPAEWDLLLNEIAGKSNFSVVLNALSDIMVLLCDFVVNQLKIQQGEDNKLLVALQCCLQNYNAFVVSAPKSREQEVLAINSLCGVLKHIPDPLKPTEGMSLINALPEEALKLLADDKAFVARIVLINDKQLCKALAQKVLASRQRES